MTVGIPKVQWPHLTREVDNLYDFHVTFSQNLTAKNH